jgi:hypothetical protein
LTSSSLKKKASESAKAYLPKVKALLGFGIDLRNICEKIQNTARVTPLVIVPGDKLDEVLVKRDTGLGIED